MKTHDLKTKTELTNKPKTDNSQKQKPLIIIVEDEPLVARCLELQLSPYFDLEFFIRAEAALPYICEHAKAIKLIILDYMLPGMNGLQLLSIIRRNQNLKHLRIILQSGACIGSETAEADSYLEKPWTNQQMLSVIKNILR